VSVDERYRMRIASTVPKDCAFLLEVGIFSVIVIFFVQRQKKILA